jgi:hypothetical protein
VQLDLREQRERPETQALPARPEQQVVRVPLVIRALQDLQVPRGQPVTQVQLVKQGQPVIQAQQVSLALPVIQGLRDQPVPLVR